MNKPFLAKLITGVSAVAALTAMGTTNVLAQQAGASRPSGYVTDSSGKIWRNNYGECWRTGYWTPALAVPECEPGMAKKEVKVVEKAAPPPAGPEKPAFEKMTIQAETLFDFDKATLRPEGKAKLDEVVAKMQEAKSVELVLVTGHTDRIGTAAYNQKLSERRAATVKNYLVSKGVDANRIETVGKGESEPVTTDCKGGPENRRNKKLIACLQPDRRVVIEVKVQNPTGPSSTSGSSAPANR